MDDSLCELTVSDVLAAVPMRPGQEAGLVVLAEVDAPFRTLPMYIGQPEARSIQAGRRGDPPARPTTWDLYVSTLGLLRAELERAVIERVEEGRHFYARLDIVHEGSRVMVSCRPSDAIAIAVRVPTATLYATERVLSAAGRYPAPAPLAVHDSPGAVQDNPASAEDGSSSLRPDGPLPSVPSGPNPEDQDD